MPYVQPLPECRAFTAPNPAPGPSLPDFTALAETLQETAQALRRFCHTGVSANDNNVDEDDAVPTAPKTPPEIRSYQLPGFIVDEEQQMLNLYKAESWQDMLGKVHDQLYTIAMLMRHFEADEKVDGFSIHLMGCTLMEPLTLLSRLCSLVADFRLTAEVEL